MPRPRKYLPANGVDIIKDCASRGVRESEIARALGMSMPTWRRIREEDPKAAEAYQEAKAVELDSLVGKLYEKAMDGDSAAAMFLLKSRHGYRDHGPADGDDSRVNINLTLPTSLDPDKYQRLIEHSAKAVEDQHG